MIRAIDRFLKQGHLVTLDYTANSLDLDVRQAILTMAADGTLPAFVVDNVAEYWINTLDAERLDIGSIPNVAPPMAQFWMEWRAPKSDYIPADLRIAAGMFAYEEYPPEAGWKDEPGLPNTPDHPGLVWFAKMFDVAGNGVGTASQDRINAWWDAGGQWFRWIAMARMFVQLTSGPRPKLPVPPGVRDDDVFGPLFSLYFPVFPNGEPLVAPNGEPAVILTSTSPTKEGQDADQVWAENMMAPMLLGLSFLHCRNVVSRDETPDAKLSRAWKRRTGSPLTTYKTLVIDPMREVLEREGGVSRNGITKALHICRGHFATYTEDAPLFGRVTGTFWKPAHVRGTLASGKVVKNYAVRPRRSN